MQQGPAEPGLSAAVSASAGTGKTYLLVTRIIRLLLAGARPEGILALTFTRKAAAEMRDRLFDRLSELALVTDTELLQALAAIDIPQPDQYLMRARELFERVLYADQRPRITTFHSFCQELLHRFPLEADVPAGYELLETTGIIGDMAWDALCLQATRQPDSELARALTTLFIICGGLNNTRDTLLNGFLQHRSDWWAYTENQKDPVAYARSKIEQKLQATKQPLRDFFNQQNCGLLGQYSVLLQQHATSTNLGHCEKLLQGQQPERDLQQRFQLIKTVFLTQSGEPRKLKASNALLKNLGAANQQRLLSLHQQLLELVMEALEQDRRTRYLELNNAWYLAGQSLLDHYQAIKQKQRLLDFTDLEWRCYQLLHASDQALWVQYKLDQRIDHLLLDEFQDTNPTQWQLILPLLEEIAGSSNERLRSVFLVGDSKQSIYSFRRANPRLQYAASQWLTQHLNAKSFPLSKSWRSAPAIIEFLNAVFSNTDDSALRLPDYELHATHKENLWGQVIVLPAATPSIFADEANQTLRDPLTQPRLIAQNDAHYQEGLQIAATIQTLLSENRTITKQSKQCPLDYGDTIILLRNRTHIAQYEQALTDREIPFIGIEKGGLLECLEIQDIEALLNVLITPFNNQALAQILRSPIMAASDHDLQKLVMQTTGNWYEKLLQLEPDDCSPALKRAARLLPHWRSLVGHLPVHDLLDRIYFEADIINRYQQAATASLRAGVSANLQQLLEIALQIDSGRFPSLIRFLSRLNKLRNSHNEAPDSPTASQTTAKVRLMTIHGAKGLEAPVVFLADCGSSTLNKDTYNAVVDWPAEATRPELILLAARKEDSPELLNHLRLKNAEARSLEEANLLYVALSRAKHLLVISAASDNEKTLLKSWYGLLKNAMEKKIGEAPIDGQYSFQSGEWICYNEPKNKKPAPDVAPPPKIEISTSAVQTSDPTTNSSNRFQARRRGTLLHKLIEHLSSPDPVTSVNLSESENIVFSDEEFLQAKTQAEKIIDNPRFAFLFNPDKYTQAFKELPVSYKNNNNAFHYGVIDRLVLIDDTAWIVDYKNHTGISDSAELEKLAQSFRPQLDYYAAGVKKIWPQRKIRRAILFTHSEKLIELD
ncbi:MAG: UvrD-helicase domain-containing protein [Gammaproteobacteria bacterium]|nr:UvrD-helicase domain-containing protein [Gammaproteobacteria bacterium]